MIEAIPEVPLRNVMVCPRADIPRDERSLAQHDILSIPGLALHPFSPMQAGLPPIDADPQVALKRAFNGLRRTRFRAPELPAEYLGSPDLGSLAVRGPFACYTTRVDDSRPGSGICCAQQLRAPSRADEDRLARVVPPGSSCDVRCRPTESNARWARSRRPIHEWDQACKIALCAASTHLSLVRHFNWVHLAGGAQLAIATRNCLSADHPLCRLLWPYIYGTQQSNDMVTRGQMVPGGDFETTFSFTFDGMCRLFDDTYLQYPHIVNDPEADGDARGVRGAGFDTPTQDNLEALFDVMHRFVRNYLKIYYSRSRHRRRRRAQRPPRRWLGSRSSTHAFPTEWA